jgi:hypothetical protein
VRITSGVSILPASAAIAVMSISDGLEVTFSSHVTSVNAAARVEL